MEALQAPLPTGSERSPYQPIDSDAGEIRLVKLLPGGYDDPIDLTLHTVKLEQRVTDEGSDENMSDLANSHQEKSDDEHWYEPALYCEFEYEALSRLALEKSYLTGSSCVLPKASIKG
ncbi:hypothetical protein J4E86_006395 [Alternaria arbusti]|uniref:uncharacterized protein n=1 Tax=Alternaria arbusti TaxID=232088 RepID=UPI0022205908|nr:uncharacterized protein J4E86_006395 [Alternaria arbusti]KAI4952859.1 hypothetical protein J4E86_006395 [Alternaria arbusti]